MHSLGFVEFGVWLLVIEALSVGAFPLIARILPSAPDRGYGLSKVVGLFLFGLLAWLLPTVFDLDASRFLFTSVFAVLVLVGALQYSQPRIAELIATSRKHIVTVEILFCGLTILFAAIRFLNSEIHWGEKPMDSTFLHFFTRNDISPPEDPWAAGSLMRYYYLGVYFIAGLLKLTGIAPAIGYNLAISTLAGLIGAALYSLFTLFVRGRWIAFGAALFVVLSCNPEALALIFFRGDKPSFDTFWASSRIFVSPGFFEYTSWSLLFADLHAHVIAIPFTILALSLAVYLTLHSAERYTASGFAVRALLGVVIGALFGMNSWDFLTYGAFIGALLVTAPVPIFWRPPARPDGTIALGERAFAVLFARAVALLWDIGVVALAARSIGALFERKVLAGTEVRWGWVVASEFNSLGHILKAVGFLWIPMAATLLVALGRRVLATRGPSHLGPRTATATTGLLAMLVAGSSLAPVVASSAVGVAGQSLDVVGASFCLVAFAFAALWQGTNSPASRILFLVIYFSTFLILLLEHIYLFDRMNTLFKGYMAVWMLTSIAAVAIVARFGEELFQKPGLRRSRHVFMCIVAFLVAANAFGTALNMYGIVSKQRIQKREFTLDGSAYLQTEAPGDFEVIQWLNRHVAGTPTILEAHGDAYRTFSRISMHTGLPTVLGWSHHVQQRGLSGEAVADRQAAIATIYMTTDIDHTLKLLERYRVDFIIIGDQERATYGNQVDDKFAGHPEFFAPVSLIGSSRIYVTARSWFYSRFKK